MKTLEFRNIYMDFPGVRALNDISFSAEEGKVISLLGENGAGKSTLLKILYGDYKATSGKIFIDNKEILFANPHDAIRSGVSVIYQERQLYQNQTVAENVFAGALPVNAIGLVNYKKLNILTQKIINDFDIPIKPTEKIKNLRIAHQQLVEIMKAINRNLQVVAFDEPTTSLTDKETEKLFEIISKLRTKGLIILYVSHRIKEIFRVCDDVVVLKDGKLIDKVKISDASEEGLVKMMVGRKLGDIFNNLDRNKEFGDTILNVNNINTLKIKNASFDLKEGEILGFFGLVGAGRSELMQAIFGMDKVIKGEILFNGKKILIRDPAQAIKHGIGLCPEDRKLQAIMPNHSIKDNISILVLNILSKFGIINRTREKQIVQKYFEKMNIQAPDINKRIIFLSGGNQQKTIVARWLAANPKILILDEPTKGIDVGAKAEMYKIICSLAKEKIGVIFISSELPEIIGLCDRVLVVKNGKIVGEVLRRDASEEKLLKYAVL